MLAFSSAFPRRGKGPEKGQGTGPLVTRAGVDKVPIKLLGSKAAGPGSSLPYSQRVHKEQGTYLERETPRTPDDVAAEEAEKELAKEQARNKRRQAKRAREEVTRTEASKKQREEVPGEHTPAPVLEISDVEEVSPPAQLLTRDKRSKAGDDVQLPSPTPAVPETEEAVHRPGKEVMDSETAAPTLEVPGPVQTAVPSADEVLPAIPDFPEGESHLGMNEANYVEVNEPRMREELLNRIHDPEMAAEAEALWNKGGVDAYVKESLRVSTSFLPFLVYNLSVFLGLTSSFSLFM